MCPVPHKFGELHMLMRQLLEPPPQLILLPNDPVHPATRWRVISNEPRACMALTSSPPMVVPAGAGKAAMAAVIALLTLTGVA
jgi:hypothetical protein